MNLNQTATLFADSYLVSAILGVTLPSVPNVTVGIEEGAIIVRWDPASGADSYQIRSWWDGLAAWKTLDANLTTTEFVHTDTTEGVEYYYIVRASNQAGRFRLVVSLCVRNGSCWLWSARPYCNASSAYNDSHNDASGISDNNAATNQYTCSDADGRFKSNAVSYLYAVSNARTNRDG